MLFGLSNSGSSFCYLMEMCLGDQQFVTLLLYLDNICVFATSIDKMLDHNELVFQWLEEFNLKIKSKKCHFFQPSVVFPWAFTICRGYICKPQEGRKSKELVSANQSKKNYNHFWGCPLITAILYQNSTAIAKCLHQLVSPANCQKSKKNKKREPMADQNRQNFMWTGKHQEAFDLLKSCLTSPPVLGYPDFNHPFELETNTSLKGLGAILSQRDKNGTSCVIPFASRSLQSSKQLMQNNSSAKLELLALKWAVMEKLRDYLLHSKFHCIYC